MMKRLIKKLAQQELSSEEYQQLLALLQRKVANYFSSERFEIETYDVAMDILTAFMDEGGFLSNFEEIHSELSDDEFIKKFNERFDRKVREKLDRLIKQRDGNGFSGICDRAQLPDDYDVENEAEEEW